jgi:2-polyprenyl-3-methyl-5-hydroxy-6-metoxy-1,4-benzoquinol methylase
LSRRDRPSPKNDDKRRPPRASAVDRELEAGSLAHYEDPAYYAATYGRRIEDIAYYVALAQRLGGPVLEYGAGNGRIALPLARHGIEVVGVDHSAPCSPICAHA